MESDRVLSLQVLGDSMFELPPMGTPLMGNKKHVLVCVNDRETGSCCNQVGGFDVFRSLKDFVKNNGLVGSVWVTQTGCLGFCNDNGATVVIYPDRRWFTKVKMEDIPAIIEIALGTKRCGKK